MWLVLLELTVVNLGWHFQIPFTPLFLQVIWAIGVSMIVLAGLVRLPRAVVAIIAVALIAGHNLLDQIQPEALGLFGPLWVILHVQTTLPQLGAFVAYPLLPWIGVMALGWVLGPLLRRPPRESRRWFLLLGAGLTLAWLVLRLANTHGDPTPWHAQESAALTLGSFLNAGKYPPSLVFLLMTLGPALVVLALIHRVREPIGGFLRVFGEVPLFYYVLHIFAVHALAIAVGTAQGFGPGQMAQLFLNLPKQGYGLSLPWVYVAWLGLVASLYPVSRWFAGVKRSNRGAWWTSYV